MAALMAALIDQVEQPKPPGQTQGLPAEAADRGYRPRQGYNSNLGTYPHAARAVSELYQLLETAQGWPPPHASDRRLPSQCTQGRKSIGWGGLFDLLSFFCGFYD